MPVKTTDRWDGEDEDDVKDNWEDEDEEGKNSDNKEDGDDKPKAFQRKKKKLADRIAEKQAAKAAAEEAEKEKNRKLTPEEELAEKMRRQRLQEESDLLLAKEAFGGGKAAGGIDGMFPEDEESFSKFGEALKNKITLFEKSKHYSSFLEQLFTDLVVSLEAEDCRKLGQNLTNIYHEKQKQAKEAAKKSKKKSKITLRQERDNDFNDLAASSGGNYDYNDFEDDFI